MIYTSISNKRIKDLRKLNDKKYRDQTGLFLVEGKHLVDEAYRHDYLKEVFILDGTNLSYNVKTSYVSENVMRYISSLDSPFNVIGLCVKKSDEIFGNVLILDNIQDPGNLGTIIRSCAAFNIDTIILDRGVDPYNSKVLRASEGMVFCVNIVNGDLNYVIPKLRESGYKIYGTNVKNGKSLKSLGKFSKFAIIVGNEARGVRSDILDKCDGYIYIPMNKKCESLNVAVATSIILYEISR